MRVMKKFSMLLIAAACCHAGICQTTITNGGFENWGNTVPAGDTHTEPTNWYSNQSGSSIAQLGGETCFQDASIFHSGLYSVRVTTISGPLSTVINGNVTTGVVDAPTLTKSDGYIGTVNYSSSSDDRRMAFTGRPDSLVGWYQYTQGGSSEQGKIRAILHTGDYYDPETPTTYHPDPTANKIADLTFLTPMSNVSTWTRFSMPFTYVSSSSPAYIMINMTSSADQGTTVTGSTFWVDDLEAIYNPPAGVTTPTLKENDVTVYSHGNMVTVRFDASNEATSDFTLSDIEGRLVFSTPIDNSGTHDFTFSSLPAGIYVYKLGNSSIFKTGKLFIK